MRGVFEKVQASLKHIIAYEKNRFYHPCAYRIGFYIVSLPDELQDEDRDTGALYHGQHREQGLGCQLAGAVYLCLRTDG